jgi:hypothetical protein
MLEIRKTGDKKYKSCFVYKTDNYAGHMFGGERRPETAASFSNFSFSGTAAEIRVICKFDVKTVSIRPLNFGIIPKINGNVITFTLSAPQKISVEVNDRLNPLLILSDSPDVPDIHATYYYGPGVHRIGLKKNINSNETVYISAGAVVEGSFKLPDHPTNITFKGRGILTTGSFPHLTNNLDSLVKYSMFAGNGQYGPTSHLTFEGLTLVNGAAWTFTLANPKNNANVWSDINIIGWNGNTDGIWFAGDNNLVENCFIFNNDDPLVTHGSTNCIIRNITIWGGLWGRIFFHQAGGSSDNLLFENINVIGRASGDPIIRVIGTRGSSYTNITFRNMRVEFQPWQDSTRTGRFFDFRTGKVKEVNGMVPPQYSNWTFENITLDQFNDDGGQFIGSSNGIIKGVTFKNFVIKNKLIKSLEEAKMTKNEFASDIIFK